MNTYNSPYLVDNFRNFFKKKSVLQRLILINAGVFALVTISNLVLWLFKLKTQDGMSLLTYWLAVPSSFDSLITKPWTVLSYMFLHEGFFHLFFNMLILYFGGTIFLQYLNERQLLGTYIIGGLMGAIFYIVSYNTFPVFLEATTFAIAMGASASVLAIMIAIASFVPQYTVQLMFFGPVRLKYLAVAFIVIDIFSIQGNNPGGHIAHLGGAFWGFLYILILKNGTDLLAFLDFGSRKKKFSKSFGNSTGYTTQKGRPLTDDEYNKQKNIDQKKIDEILDRISKSGYDSLSNKEKELLFKNSNQKR
ncbi:MAG: rhomboid family intramembrane serine protease [Ignavibacteria bacterium]|nr:rhomboid family intramembrane serine protease [Ignavibacteria bacterium]